MVAGRPKIEIFLGSRLLNQPEETLPDGKPDAAKAALAKGTAVNSLDRTELTALLKWHGIKGKAMPLIIVEKRQCGK